ncbi:MAG: SCO family protein [Acidimicrobiia bacterium]|nr:SCO family protein [Acidimicrobiia bacterium]
MRKVVLLLALLALVASACSSEPEELSGFVRTPLPSVAGIALPDGSAGGEPLQMVAAEGELLLVYFGYTECPDICPTTLADIRNALREIGDDAERISLAMETIDIDRDTEEIVTAYVRSFVPDAHGLRAPDDATLRAAADAFGADYSVVINEEGVYEVGHTAHTYAVNDEGLILVTWAFGTEPEIMAQDLRLLLKDA